MMDLVFLFRIPGFFFFIPLSLTVYKEHSRLLSITCHSLAIGYYVIHRTIWNFFASFALAPTLMILPRQPPIMQLFVYYFFATYVEATYSCRPCIPLQRSA